MLILFEIEECWSLGGGSSRLDCFVVLSRLLALMMMMMMMMMMKEQDRQLGDSWGLYTH